MEQKGLGARLREAREAAGLTQIDAAQRLGITNSALSNYERGERDPDTALLSRLAALYRVSTDFLLEVSNDALRPNNDIDPEIAVIMRSLKGRTEEQRQSILAFIRYLDEQEERAKRTQERGDRTKDEPPAHSPPGAGADPRHRGPKART